jgi:2-iminobutanoate/2-iminopropanoate deaminase
MRAAISLFFVLSVLAQKKVITPPEWVKPAGAPQPLFSPGILADGTLYISGQTGTDPVTGKLPDTFEGEMKQAFANVAAVLKAAGMGFGDVVAVTVYLSDIEQFAKMNAVYATYFSDPKPTRSTIAAAHLVGNNHIEITVTARR